QDGDPVLMVDCDHETLRSSGAPAPLRAARSLARRAVGRDRPAAGRHRCPIRSRPRGGDVAADETGRGGPPRHGPRDEPTAPRFTGPRTYARLPYVKDLAGVDAAVFGLPWDGSTSFRSGARFGPEAVRSASGMIRTYNHALRVQVFGVLSTIDYGDAPTAPGYVEQTLERMEAFVRPVAESGAIPIGIGGDHLLALAEARALAEAHGPL